MKKMILVEPGKWPKIFREIREEQGLTKDELASKMGVAPATVASLEKGKGNLRTFEAALEHLKTEISLRPYAPTEATIQETIIKPGMLNSKMAQLRRSTILDLKQVTQVDLSIMVNTTTRTISAFEKHGNGKPSWVMKIPEMLGQKVYFVTDHINDEE